MSNTQKIVIATPVNNRGKILPYFLNKIANIDYDKKLIDMYFLLNNSNDNSKEILMQFKREHEKFYNSITIDKCSTNYKFEDKRTTETRLKYTYYHLSEVRNKLLEYARKLKVDYLFSIDSDILVPKDVINKLITANEPIVSSLIYNGYIVDPEKAYKYPNIMNVVENDVVHITNWYVKNAKNLTESKVVPVDVTGAISLISKEVLKSGAIYAYHPKGEDVYFSIDAKQKGFQSYCDISCFSEHIMTDGQLNELSREKRYEK